MTLGSLLHSEHNPVSSIVNHVHMKQFIRGTRDFPEIKLAYQPIHLKVTGKLNIFCDLQIHNRRVKEQYTSILMQKFSKAFITIHNVKNFPGSCNKEFF